MKSLLQALVLAVIVLTAHAGDVSFNGTKPAAIIDVRTPEEFASGHIDGAVNIPVDRIGQGIQSVKGLKKDSPILVYCRSGRRSAMARTALEQQGYTNILDGGGIDDLAKKLKPCTVKTC
jgi:rhodanese-related sulfurtransferase